MTIENESKKSSDFFTAETDCGLIHLSSNQESAITEDEELKQTKRQSEKCYCQRKCFKSLTGECASM